MYPVLNLGLLDIILSAVCFPQVREASIGILVTKYGNCFLRDSLGGNQATKSIVWGTAGFSWYGHRIPRRILQIQWRPGCPFV